MDTIGNNLYKTMEHLQKRIEDMQKEEQQKSYFLWNLVRELLLKKATSQEEEQYIWSLEPLFIQNYEQYSSWLEQHSSHFQWKDTLKKKALKDRLKNPDYRIYYLENHVYEHPHQCFTVSDIMNLTGFSKDTCRKDMITIARKNPAIFETLKVS